MKQEKDDGSVLEAGASTAKRPTHSEDGVDLTLIRWMLSLTPLERVEVLQQHIQAVRELQDGNPHLR